MKVVILAGGLGTRLSEETTVKPKPMAEIGEKPVLWHIMKTYSHYGFNEFVICLGYKGYMVKEWFSNYFLHNCDVTFDLSTNSTEIHESNAEPWRVTLVDTGLATMTAGRLRRVANYVSDDTFMLTYGDGVADVNIADLLAFHRSHGRIGTVTAVQPPGRFGSLDLGEKGLVRSFQEKPVGDGAWINGGFFVLEPAFLGRILDDSEMLEGPPLEELAEQGELVAYRHGGFWQPMDTLRDKRHLEEMWNSGSAPWKVW